MSAYAIHALLEAICFTEARFWGGAYALPRIWHMARLEFGVEGINRLLHTRSGRLERRSSAVKVHYREKVRDSAPSGPCSLDYGHFAVKNSASSLRPTRHSDRAESTSAGWMQHEQQGYVGPVECQETQRTVDVVPLLCGDGRGPVEESVGWDRHNTGERCGFWHGLLAAQDYTGLCVQLGSLHCARQVAGEF